MTLESKINKNHVKQPRGVLRYLSHIVATPRGRGLKTGIDFAHFSLVLRELRKRKELSIASIPTDIERMMVCEFEMNFKKSFCWRSNQSNFRSENTPLFLRPGLKKRCGKGHFFLSEIGSGSTCTPTKISQEQPPPGETSRTRLVSSIPLCTRDLCEFKIFNYSVYRC